MTRRDLSRILASGMVTQMAAQAAPDQPEQIAMLVYPGMTALDLIGPQQIFGYTQGCKVELVWKTDQPVVTDTGLKLFPTVTLGNAPNPTILFVPGGGRGTIALMSDPEILGWLAEKGKSARYITSVCSGSLVLGAAGLLRGYQATSHWAVREVLPVLGAQLAPGRVVEDRNRITAGGVTAGIDFGLHLVAKLRGEDYARSLQLMLEYDPHPPFDSGTPERARPATRDFATQLYAPLLKAAQASAEAARAKFSKG